MWYRKVKDQSIHTLATLSCRKDEYIVDGESNEHDQQCQVRSKF